MSSRTLPGVLGKYCIAALVQSNFGGVLQIDGARVGELLGQHYLRDAMDNDQADGSIMTDSYCLHILYE